MELTIAFIISKFSYVFKNEFNSRKVLNTFVDLTWGKEKKHYCCSDGCRDAIMSVLGVGRAAMTSRKLVPVYQR